MKKHLMMFVLLVFTGLLAIGQTVQITGLVSSSEDGLPMPGVTVKVQGLTVGAVTGTDGVYSLQAPRTATALEFSFIGMQTQVVPINNRTMINVTLVPDLVAMEEIVVIAYGTARKESLTGSAAVIDSKKMESRSVSSVAQVLTGSTTGVQTTAGSGQPGSSPSIIIRGVGTLNTSTDPLIVLDGSEYSGSLASINPSDIASMTILKDASSTALYGSRAANGVILITTKRGKTDKLR